MHERTLQPTLGISEKLPQSASAPGNEPGLKNNDEQERIPLKVVAEAARHRLDTRPRTVVAALRNGKILREHNLHTVCEEASCPNIGDDQAVRRRS
jgi:lipoate synthase